MGRKLLKILLPAVLVPVLLLAGTRLAGYRPMRYPADTGGSMCPTICPGDTVLCRMRRGYTSDDLARGMVILFRKESFEFLSTKRIIALGNQTIAVKGRATFVDGERIQEPHAFYSGEKASGANRQHGTSEVETMGVPPGKLFVMGDNRDDSFDSRDPAFGLVDVEDVVGQPLIVLWARDKSRIGRPVR